MPFFGSYLLVSLNPTRKGRTYIGFTVNPERRLRQHNGELTKGAKARSTLLSSIVIPTVGSGPK